MRSRCSSARRLAARASFPVRRQDDYARAGAQVRRAVVPEAGRIADCPVRVGDARGAGRARRAGDVGPGRRRPHGRHVHRLRPRRDRRVGGRLGGDARAQGIVALDGDHRDQAARRDEPDRRLRADRHDAANGTRHVPAYRHGCPADRGALGSPDPAADGRSGREAHEGRVDPEDLANPLGRQ